MGVPLKHPSKSFWFFLVVFPISLLLYLHHDLDVVFIYVTYLERPSVTQSLHCALFRGCDRACT